LFWKTFSGILQNNLVLADGYWFVVGSNGAKTVFYPEFCFFNVYPTKNQEFNDLYVGCIY